MSGGSHNYLCWANMPDVINRTKDMEKIEQNLIELGYTDIAKDVRRLIEYCKSAEIRISVLFEQLEDVFHDVEWYHSADIGEDDLIKTLEQYRKVVLTMTCKDNCLYSPVCRLPFNTSETQVNFAEECHHFKNKADFVEVKHGKWLYWQPDGTNHLWKCSVRNAYNPYT